MQFTSNELYDLINRPGPLWLFGADLSWANLRGANLTSANLSMANLLGTSLNGANLSKANLTGACLNGADLREADLKGATLHWAALEEAKLFGAKYNQKTRWPDGFNPRAAEAIFVDIDSSD
ncbi:MAG: pentapeptide repeat-containing protein [Anaerolineales bacterium]|jgi:uncharacterized protein YjbI with pentapeptide repeats